MHLDVGVAPTKITDEDYDDPNDVFTPYADENLDDFENILDDFDNMVDDNIDNTGVNFNDDVSKMAINDILKEMRMGSPIEDDLINEVFTDDSNNNIKFENSDVYDSAININKCYNYVCDRSEYFNDGLGNSDNSLDQLLCPVACSTPDVQVEFNDGVQFQYDASEQFNCEPNAKLTYSEDSLSETVMDQDTNAMSFENTYNSGNHTNHELNQYLDESIPYVSNNQYFQCSTNLPMTPEELQDDIQKYVNSEQNYNYTSLYGYAGISMMDDISYEEDEHAFDFTYKSPEYMGEQNTLFQNLDPMNPIDPYGPLTITPPEQQEAFQCNSCPFYTLDLREFTRHMREHTEIQLNCTECKFTPNRASNPKQNQETDDETTYCCQSCNYVTHSSSKVRSHMRREH